MRHHLAEGLHVHENHEALGDRVGVAAILPRHPKRRLGEERVFPEGFPFQIKRLRFACGFVRFERVLSDEAHRALQINGFTSRQNVHLLGFFVLEKKRVPLRKWFTVCATLANAVHRDLTNPLNVKQERVQPEGLHVCNVAQLVPQLQRQTRQKRQVRFLHGHALLLLFVFQVAHDASCELHGDLVLAEETAELPELLGGIRTQIPNLQE
mmetsp:Transcript_50689/g.141925  ORF Transcript_50689/g.141925 Transcript_50689/m.141925 type:complete len:210 (-) Transcript_50689:605-1234(-)